MECLIFALENCYYSLIKARSSDNFFSSLCMFGSQGRSSKIASMPRLIPDIIPGLGDASVKKPLSPIKTKTLDSLQSVKKMETPQLPTNSSPPRGTKKRVHSDDSYEEENQRERKVSRKTASIVTASGLKVLNNTAVDNKHEVDVLKKNNLDMVRLTRDKEDLKELVDKHSDRLRQLDELDAELERKKDMLLSFDEIIRENIPQLEELEKREAELIASIAALEKRNAEYEEKTREIEAFRDKIALSFGLVKKV